MFTIKIKRVFGTAFKNILRNLWLSVATVIIIVIALFTMATMIAVDAVGDHALGVLQEKIDISVQFKGDAPEGKIMELKKDLEGLGQVKNAEYVSKEQALVNFKETHKEDAFIDASLNELGENPLFAVLNVKANALDQYKSIDDYLTSNENYRDIIEEVNFKENERAINNFSMILKTVKDAIFALTALFIFIGILVAFNTIRLAMYAHKKEIEIMRLVGASNWYIRIPFVIEGAFFGLVSTAITLAIVFPIAVYLSPEVRKFLPGFDLNGYFMNNIQSVALLLLGVGVGVGVISSLIAIRRYLKI